MDRDSEDFIELITSAQMAIYAYIMTLCHDHSQAKDILQETNLTLWRKAENYEDGTNFNAWACKTAYYHVLNHRRRQTREKMVFDDDLFDYLAERQEQRAEQSDDRVAALRHCVTKLSDKNRELIERRYQPDASVQAMAEADGKSEGAISQALFRVRSALQKCIESQMSKIEAI